MSESEKEKEIPNIHEVLPEDMGDVINLLKDMGLVNLDGNTKVQFPFELRIKLTDTREVDVHVIWGGNKKYIKDIALILQALTDGSLNKEILLALTSLAGNDQNKMDAVSRLAKRWTKLRYDGEERPYIDSFQPLMQERG